ncbi:MAG: ATP-binding protein [Sedimentisphaerales bacterium]|jgi:nitrogen fixation/metabolism regulation signal transduction histidine kinase|nr:ATP-binding protein [Sedimentisphaerales bacterium]
MRYEQRIFLLSLTAGLMGLVPAVILFLVSDYSVGTQVTVIVLLVLVALGIASSIAGRVAFPLRTLSNLIGALREGDYSMRARGARHGDALGEAIWEVNALAASLREQRLGAIEATALLRKVLAQIDVAMFGFDSDRRLHLVNDSGRRLLARTEEELLGCRADELGLAECLEGVTPRLIDLACPGGSGRWELRRGSYRERGVSHQLLFLSDLTRTLHEEERRAWERLIRTLRHEVNNSLTPIQSVAESLRTLIDRRPRSDDWDADLREGLAIIAERSEALDRFIGAYSRLARLPQPQLGEVAVADLFRRVVGLEMRMQVIVEGGPEVSVRGDRDQLEQLLINVISNAVESSLLSHPAGDGRVAVSWQADAHELRVCIDDDGVGLENGTDAFVPFYTSKEHGSGIGLTLCRQIAEAHAGTLTLENHPDRPGCRATLRLPLT